MPYLDTELFLTLAPAYQRLDVIHNILEREQLTQECDKNTLAWFKLTRIHEHAKEALSAMRD